jgi:hypothetical protein
MIRVDYDSVEAAKAAARARGVPSWVASDIERLYGCAWMNCDERFATSEAAQAHIAEHDARIGYVPYWQRVPPAAPDDEDFENLPILDLDKFEAECCEECDDNDKREARVFDDAGIAYFAHSKDGDCTCKWPPTSHGV